MKVTDYKWVLLICIASSILMYHLTFQYGQNLDDFLVFDSVPYGKDFIEGTKQIFSSLFSKNDYRPILILSYFLETFIYPTPNYEFSHIINVLLYGFLCFSIYVFLNKLPLIKNRYIALIITLLFLFHPLHTNVVCNLKSRDNILSLLLTIWALYFWAKTIYDKQYYFAVLALSFMYLGTIAKLDAMYALLIPIVMFGFDKQNRKYSLLGIIFLFALNLISILVIGQNQKEKVFKKNTVVKNIEYYNENPLLTDTTLSRWSAGGTTFLYYLKFNVFPKDYYYYYGYNAIEIRKPLGTTNIGGYAIFILLIAFAIYSFFIKKSLAGFGVQWFLIAIVFFLNILQPVPGIVADRHAFIASLGFCIVIGAGISSLADYRKISPNYILIPILLIYAYSSYQRSKDWKDILTLVEADIPFLKNSYDANRIASQNYLTAAVTSEDAYQRQTYLDKAKRYALQGLEVYDKEFILHNIIGKIELFQGDTSQSINALNQGIKLYENVEGNIYLGDIYFMKKDYHTASQYYEKGYNIDAQTIDLEYKIIDAYCRAKQFDKADSMNTIIAKNPTKEYIPIENKGYIAIYQQDTATAYHFLSLALQKGLIDDSLALKIADYYKRHPLP